MCLAKPNFEVGMRVVLKNGDRTRIINVTRHNIIVEDGAGIVKVLDKNGRFGFGSESKYDIVSIELMSTVQWFKDKDNNELFPMVFKENEIIDSALEVAVPVTLPSFVFNRITV
jgi:hypothetical protein